MIKKSTNDGASTRIASSIKSEKVKEQKANIPYLIGLSLTLGCSSMQFGLALAATGPISPALRYQLEWGNDRSEIDFNITCLSTSALVGIALGCIFAGDFIKYGRRKTIIV